MLISILQISFIPCLWLYVGGLLAQAGHPMAMAIERQYALCCNR